MPKDKADITAPKGDKEPVVDAEEFKAEIKKGVKETTSALKDELQANQEKQLEKVKTEATEAAKKAIVDKITDTPDEGAYSWQKKGFKDPAEAGMTWDQVAGEIEERTEKRLEDKNKVQQEEAKKAQGVKAAQTKESLKVMHGEWDEQVKYLEEQKLIPAPAEEIQKKLDKSEVLTEEEKQDPGIQARDRLYSLGATHKKRNLIEVHQRFYSNQPGADAPVMGANRSRAPQTDKYSYEDVHNKSMDQIAAGE